MSGHNWKIKSFNNLVFCDHCGALLWGICTQGYQCSDCNFSAHSRCCSMVTAQCAKNPKSMYNRRATPPKEHIFHKTSKSISKFCNVCRDTTFTISTDPYMCKDCKFVAHSDCKSKAPSNCHENNDIVNNNNNNNNPNNVVYHHWVEGNLKQSKKCIQCNNSCEKTFSLAHYKCIWCFKYVHSACFDKHNPVCDLGVLADMIIPPTSVHLINQPQQQPQQQIPNSSSKEDLGKLEWKLVAPIPEKTLFVFINSKSGGQLGTSFMRKLSSILNPVQLIDLIHDGPDHGVKIIHSYLQQKPSDYKKFRILVCGGDGTVGWVLHVMRKYELPSIPIGIIPLGTGNDMARSFGWGGGYNKEKLPLILREIGDSRVHTLDLWNLEITGKENKTITMNNYFSIGIDANIALGFHTARNANPSLFTGRTVNKLWYTKIGLEEFVTTKFVKLSKILRITVNGVELILDKSIKGIMILNLGSYAGGVDLWGKKAVDKFKKQYIDDQLLEVVAVTSLPHLGSCLSNIANPIRLAQGNEIVIEHTKREGYDTTYQVDGEPYNIDSCTFKISFFKQVNMLTHKNFKTRTCTPKIQLDFSTVEVSIESTNNTTDNLNLPISTTTTTSTTTTNNNTIINIDNLIPETTQSQISTTESDSINNSNTIKEVVLQ
eukprot:gene2296-2832_t